MIEVLLLHRHRDHDDVVDGLAAALRAGALTADAVVLEARRASDAQPPQARVGPDAFAPFLLSPTAEAQVTSLTLRRLARLPKDIRPLSCRLGRSASVCGGVPSGKVVYICCPFSWTKPDGAGGK
ncbi:hypothetical protein [Streptomyces sp. S.PB5]|uniref:hypothetical protein n=1 Tax=Streptomyces sp. S.PB5 TaxID=3020844 RepID=UPI0025B0C2AA|nr:hypothetical protein [Streptomyces sp. S.PB5]MDN3029726.1 hypothetical protein [Streptomyces sp. S.PB5]